MKKVDGRLDEKVSKRKPPEGFVDPVEKGREGFVKAGEKGREGFASPLEKGRQGFVKAAEAAKQNVMGLPAQTSKEDTNE